MHRSTSVAPYDYQRGQRAYVEEDNLERFSDVSGAHGPVGIMHVRFRQHGRCAGAYNCMKPSSTFDPSEGLGVSHRGDSFPFTNLDLARYGGP